MYRLRNVTHDAAHYRSRPKATWMRPVTKVSSRAASKALALLETGQVARIRLRITIQVALVGPVTRWFGASEDRRHRAGEHRGVRAREPAAGPR